MKRTPVIWASADYVQRWIKELYEVVTCDENQ